MTEVAIQAQGISKEYYIGAIQAGKLTLQEKLARGIARPFRRIAGLARGQAAAAADLDESFWALAGRLVHHQ